MDNYREIENLIYRYAECVDLGDFEAVATLFSNGTICGSPGSWIMTGSEEILAMNRKSVKVYDETGTPCTKNIVTNVIIEIDREQRTAVARSNYAVMQGLLDFPLQTIIAGRYHDSFYYDNTWRFRERRILPEFYGDLSRHLLFNAEDFNSEEFCKPETNAAANS